MSGYGEFLKFVAMSKVVPRLRVTINQAGVKPVAGDTLSLSVPAGWTVTSPGATIDRGAGPVSLFTGLGPYALQSADIPPIGSTWPIVATGTLSAISSPTFNLSNPVVAPGAPTIGTLTASANAVSQAFTAPANNGGAAITNYLLSVYRASDNVLLGQANGSASPIVLTGLTNGVAVYGKVAAQNSVGIGAQSAASNTVTPSNVAQVDVLVYGASWPGVCAAIKARQQGASVLLVDDRDVIGGMTRSAIQFTDAQTGPVIWRATIPESGLTNQLFASLAAIYGINQNAYFRDYSYSSESKTTGQVIDQMVAASGITVVTNQELLSLTKNGTDISSVIFDGIGAVVAKQYIEASYFGDLLVKSGADKYLGGEAAATYSESAVSAGFVTTGNQPANNIDPYVTPGNSGSGLLKFVQNVNISGLGGTAVPNKVQFCGFRLSITSTAGKKVAMPAPANYVASDYELHRRDATLNKVGSTSILNFLNLQNGYPAIPSTTSGMTAKRDANSLGTFSLDFPDADLTTEYFTTANRARRIQLEDSMWQYWLGLYQFWTNDSSVPSAARANIATYGLVNDDYLATGGRPPRAYPRETYRAVGDTPCTATTITSQNALTDPVALAYYAFDKHIRQYCISSTGGDHVVQEGLTPAGVSPAFLGARIPSRVLNPKSSQVSNLQVVTTPNASAMFYNSYRVEPIMATAAEYAGIRAAIAVATSTPVQQVPHASVAPIHNLYGLDPAGGTCCTVDGTTRTQGTFAFAGTWGTTTTNIAGTVSASTCSATTGTNTFTYTPLVPTSGNWKIQLKYLDSSPNGLTRGSFTSVATIGGVAQTGMLINENSGVVGAGVTTNGDWQTVYSGALAQGDKVVGTYDNSGNAMNIVAARIVPA